MRGLVRLLAHGGQPEVAPRAKNLVASANLAKSQFLAKTSQELQARLNATIACSELSEDTSANRGTETFDGLVTEL